MGITGRFTTVRNRASYILQLLFPQDCTRPTAQESDGVVQVNLATAFLGSVKNDRPASSACTGANAIGTVITL